MAPGNVEPGREVWEKFDVTEELLAASGVKLGVGNKEEDRLGLCYYYNPATRESAWVVPAMQHKFLMDPVKHNPNLTIEIVDKTIAKVAGETEDWKRVGTTEWFRCTTSTELKFYHNRRLKVSVWECPEEIADMV